MVLIGHASDLHGDYDVLYRNTVKPDLWVFSGDMLPNLTGGIGQPVQPYRERPYQRQYMVDEGPKLVRALRRVPVICCDGNHDFVSFAGGLQAAGADSYEVCREPTLRFCGLTFSGFPFIRSTAGSEANISGEWNHERSTAELQAAIDDIFEDPPDVLVTHAPPGDVLDTSYTGSKWGIPALASALSFREHSIKAHLFGHVHFSKGEVRQGGIIFSNAATTLRFIEL